MSEALGQTLFYASQTGKQPGILLIIQTGQDNAHLERLNQVIEYFNLPIDVWSID